MFLALLPISVPPFVSACSLAQGVLFATASNRIGVVTFLRQKYIIGVSACLTDMFVFVDEASYDLAVFAYCAHDVVNLLPFLLEDVVHDLLSLSLCQSVM